ncbi:hypothetical protein GTA08_BOTSDO08305 [Botryosphaeria dothidea]|uniref:Uncharacterized protein n=1 Tax=Botryosphaeria dothidea TaxID=55169 RepID=A0A8H4N5L0_9PEZI|nr:hypothetical protein GTA08_BOTSDO08305 [Botryosphaeria dothidea]
MGPTNKTQSPATTPAPPTTSPESPNNATPTTAPPSSSTNTPQQQQQPTTNHKKLQKKPRSNSIIGRFTLFAKLGPPLPQRHSRRATTSDAERALAAKERMSIDDYREARLSRSASASSGSRYSRSEHDMARQEPKAGTSASASAQHDAGRHQEGRSTAESSSPQQHSKGESPSPPAVAEGPGDEVVCSDNGLRARVEHNHHDHAPDNATGSGKQPQGSRPRIDSATVPEGSPAVVRHHHRHHHQQRQREAEDDQNDRPRQSAVHDEEQLLNRGHDAHSEAKPFPTKGDEGAVGKLRAKSQRYREKGREKLAKTFFHRGSDGKEAAESKAEN